MRADVDAALSGRATAAHGRAHARGAPGNDAQLTRRSGGERRCQSSQIANTGDLQGVRKALEQQLEQVTSLVSTAQRKGDTVVASIAGVLVADLQQALCEACDIDVYHRHGSKSMRMKGACRSAQRCSFLTPADHACESPQVNQFNFGTPKQLSMKKSLPGPPSSSGAN